MFVFIIGNRDQNIFKLGKSNDPIGELVNIQAGNPYKLSLICKTAVASRNAAALVEKLGQQRLSKYEGAGGWFVSLPADICAQFLSGEYLQFLVSQAGASAATRRGRTGGRRQVGLHRLSSKAERQGLTFDDILSIVEEAYAEEIAIDELID